MDFTNRALTNNNDRVYISSAMTKCIGADGKRYKFDLQNTCTDTTLCANPISNAISIDTNVNNYLKDGVITVNSLNCASAANVILKAGYYSFKMSFLKRDTKNSYQTLGTQMFTLRILDCFDPLSL